MNASPYGLPYTALCSLNRLQTFQAANRVSLDESGVVVSKQS
jgi:hypothetical protein